RAERHAVALGRRVDQLGGAELRLELGDAGLDERLFLARGVVFGVLGEVAVRARLRDRARDRRALDPLQAVELVAELPESRARHRCPLDRHRLTLPSSPGPRNGRTSG